MHLDGEEENVAIKKMRVGGASMYLVVSVSNRQCACAQNGATRVYTRTCVWGGGYL